MQSFTFDGTFDGLLTVVATVDHAGMDPGDVVVRSSNQSSGGELDLFQARAVATSRDQGRWVMDRLKSVEKGRPLRFAKSAFFHRNPKRWTWIVRFLAVALRCPERVRDRRFEASAKVLQLSHEVRQETHRLKGLVRFQEIDGGLLWATITPDHDVVRLVYPYFSKRMPGEVWILFDARRGIGLRHDVGEDRPQEVTVPDEIRQEMLKHGELPKNIASSDSYFDLWRTFFDAISIEDRKNPRLQRQCMPQRYWRNLPEK